MRTFGQIIKEARKINQITQRDLAKQIDVDFTYISKIENGALEPPSEEVITKMAKVLDIDENELFLAAKKVPTEYFKQNIELKINTIRRSMEEKYKRNLLLRNEYVSNNEWNIPLVKRQDIDLKQLDFLSFDQVSRKKKAGDALKTIHFFKEDVKFQGVYNQYRDNLIKLARFRNVLTPDFSLYRDMPLALQLHNTFRNRWCGVFWQENGPNEICLNEARKHLVVR